jgi:hypothetical protein
MTVLGDFSGLITCTTHSTRSRRTIDLLVTINKDLELVLAINYMLPKSGNTKGQLISKCLFGVFNSPKKRMKKFDFNTMVPRGAICGKTGKA